MIFSDDVVDLFDSRTWSNVEYTPLVNLVHQTIATCNLHQQRCKNHVQMAVLTASNNVGEGRCLDRANDLSYIAKSFNLKVVRNLKTL